MTQNKKTNLNEYENIFHKHFIQFAIIGICGMVAFHFLRIYGWCETAALILLTTPGYIPSYLMRIRAEKNKKEAQAITHIGILSLILIIAGIILLITSSIEEEIAEIMKEKNAILSILWFTLKIFIIQILGVFSGIFPKPPHN